MAAKQNSFKQMYISTMFNKPKLIAGTSPTLTELLNPTQIKKRLCSVSSQLSELFIWEEQCQNKSTLLLAQRPFTEPLIHLFSLDFLLFKFEQSIMCGAKYRAAIFMSSVDMLLMSHPTLPNPVS